MSGMNGSFRYVAARSLRSANLHTDIPNLDGIADDFRWNEGALCAQVDPELFFPEKGGSTRDAKQLCRACDVREACLEYALEHEQRYGVWGGLSERERRRMVRQRQEVAA